MPGELSDAEVTGPAEGFEEQGVGLLPGRFRNDIIRRVQIDRIDRGRWHELQHFHDPAARGQDLIELSLLDDHVAIFLVFEAFDQFRACDGLILGVAIEDLFDARVIALMKLVEADGLTAGGRIELDGKLNHPEADVALPNADCHSNFLLSTHIALVKSRRKRRIAGIEAEGGITAGLGEQVAIQPNLSRLQFAFPVDRRDECHRIRYSNRGGPMTSNAEEAVNATGPGADLVAL